MNNTALLYASDGNDFHRMRWSAASFRKYVDLPYDLYVLTESNEDPGVEGAVVLRPESILLKHGGLHPKGWNRGWPFATLYRLAIPLLPELSGYERVVYVDTDVMARTRGANLLFTVPMRGFEIVGVQDSSIDRKPRRRIVMDNDVPQEAKVEMATRLWGPCGTEAGQYLNAGVAAWNVPKILENGIPWYVQRLKWFWTGETTGAFGHLDQDFINVMMDSVGLLSVRFNWFGGELETGAAVQHFVSRACKAGMEAVARKEGFLR